MTVIEAGSTFLMPHPRGQTDHLWIVVAEKDDEIVIVNLNTQRKGSDLTTLLEPADHPFIKHETVVTYADAMITRKDLVEKLSKTEPPGITFHAACSRALLEKVRLGIEASAWTPLKVLRFCRENLL